MQMCEDHWKKLFDGIKERGLGHLVSKNQEEAEARITLRNVTGMSPECYDPLISASMSIYENAISIMGIRVAQLDENGKHLCPICESAKSCCDRPSHRKQQEDWWLTNACDEQLHMAIVLGLKFSLPKSDQVH